MGSRKPRGHLVPSLGTPAYLVCALPPLGPVAMSGGGVGRRAGSSCQ